MSANQNVLRDERTIAVENASYKWVCIFLSFALLIDVCCRSILFQEAAWDLLAFVCVSGIFCTIYQAKQKIFNGNWQKKALLLTALGAVVGFVAAIIAMCIHH